MQPLALRAMIQEFLSLSHALPEFAYYLSNLHRGDDVSGPIYHLSFYSLAVQFHWLRSN
jgi:hypothetical protein